MKKLQVYRLVDMYVYVCTCLCNEAVYHGPLSSAKSINTVCGSVPIGRVISLLRGSDSSSKALSKLPSMMPLVNGFGVWSLRTMLYTHIAGIDQLINEFGTAFPPINEISAYRKARGFRPATC